MQRNSYDLVDILKAIVTVLEANKASVIPNNLECEIDSNNDDGDEYDTFSDRVKSYKPLADYPDFLTAKDIRDILNISLTKAYEVMNSKKCPCFTVGTQGKRVSKDNFLKYLQDSCYGSLLD